MNPARLRLDRIAHAHWRVKFLKRLLDVHRHCANRTNIEWLLEEASLLQRIAAADDELTLRKRESSGLHGNDRAAV